VIFEKRDADIKDILRAAIAQGWEIRKTTQGHFRAVPPDKTKPVVFIGGNTGDFRAIKNTLAQLRRSGFIWPPPIGEDSPTDIYSPEHRTTFRLYEPDEPMPEYWYVTAYQESQAYGGPEEGGWYFNVYEVIETRNADSEEQAEEVKLQMEVDYGLRDKAEGIGGREVPGEPLEPQRGRTALVNPDADIPDDYEPTSQADDESFVYDPGHVYITIERDPGELSRQERPHYE
jgi:hypothetical protein